MRMPVKRSRVRFSGRPAKNIIVFFLQGSPETGVVKFGGISHPCNAEYVKQSIPVLMNSMATVIENALKYIEN